jgi:hypothetical protein
LECYGIIRLGQPDKFSLPKAEQYFNEYFRQVSMAGKDCVNKSIMVIAIGIKPTDQEGILKIATQYSITIDFCNQYSDHRLPHQEDFFKTLSVMKNKNGIVSLDSTSTQSLLQAFSFGAPVMVYKTNDGLEDFYMQLLSLIPLKYKFAAIAILGLFDNYEFLKNREHCEKVNELLHSHVNKAHQRFDYFREGKLTHMNAVKEHATLLTGQKVCIKRELDTTEHPPVTKFSRVIAPSMKRNMFSEGNALVPKANNVQSNLSHGFKPSGL